MQQLQKRQNQKQMLGYVPNLNQLKNGEMFPHQKLLSQRNVGCAERMEKFAHSLLSSILKHFLDPTLMRLDLNVDLKAKAYTLLTMMMMLMIWIQPTSVVVSIQESVYLSIFALSDLLSLIIDVLDNERIEGINYSGFPLKNYASTNVYSRVTVEECQYLCEISDRCRYFNYVVKNLKFYNACYLKFGVGEKVTGETTIGNGGVFGNKYSLGNRRDF